MFHDLDTLHSIAHLFCRMALYYHVRCFLVVRMRECILCRNSTGGMSFSLCLLSGSRKSICLVIDINFGPVAKMVSAECSHHKVTIFPFVINKCLREKYFETLLMSCFSSNSCLLVLPSVVASCLPQWSLWCSDGDFPLPVLPAFVTGTPKTFGLTIRRTYILPLQDFA